MGWLYVNSGSGCFSGRDFGAVCQVDDKAELVVAVLPVDFACVGCMTEVGDKGADFTVAEFKLTWFGAFAGTGSPEFHTLDLGRGNPLTTADARDDSGGADDDTDDDSTQ